MIGLCPTVCNGLSKLVRVGIRKSSKMDYEEAVKTLNSLQSNKATLEQVRKEVQSGKKCTHLEEMKIYLQRTGVRLNKLDELSVIHVAGTKGKGSTSAMCESILREHGFKTGFYSSPHLVVVRERIRLNGKIIDEKKFSEYFSEIFNKLESTKAHNDDMPKYFHFLTVMALNVFLKEKVDVAILEVGIGGVVDSTNIVRNTRVVGITALGLDHTSVLGNTIEEIAKAKAGIMKPGCEAYTVKQDPNAMEVLYRVANEVQCCLRIVPDYNSYRFSKDIVPQLSSNNESYRSNASLAIQLAHSWLRKNCDNQEKLQIVEERKKVNCVSSSVNHKKLNYLPIIQDCINGYRDNDNDLGKCISNIPVHTVSGLSKCAWPGRYQRMKIDFAEFFIDGAHTKESVDICANWFNELSGERSKVLIFSATGDRNSENLLRSLASIDFKAVFFVVPVPYKEINEKSDTYSIQEQSNLISKCRKHLDIWRVMKKDNFENASIHECISDAYYKLKENYQHTQNQPSVLVTGSLYLVGGVLAILDPHLRSFT